MKWCLLEKKVFEGVLGSRMLVLPLDVINDSPSETPISLARPVL
jgi:hypothetical protein